MHQLIRLTFKTPYVIADALLYNYPDLTDEESENARLACEKWVKNQEYLTVEIDTKTGMARVIPVKEF